MESLIGTIRKGFDTLSSPASEQHVRVGKTTVILKNHNEEFASLCAMNFFPAPANDLSKPIVIHLVDARNTPFITVDLFTHLLDAATARGDVDAYTTPEVKVAVHRAAHTLSIWWESENTGLYFVPDVRRMPYWNQNVILRTLFAWIADRDGLQLMHAGALEKHGMAVMLPGSGGSGKSSTVLHCIGEDFRALGDDYLVVDPIERTATGLYRTIKVSPAEYRSHHADFCTAHTSTEAEGKSIYSVDIGKLTEVAVPLRALLLPKVISDSATRIEPAPRGHALRALAPTTLFQLPFASERALQRMATLVRSVPTYWLLLGSDRAAIPKALTQFFYAQPTD